MDSGGVLGLPGTKPTGSNESYMDHKYQEDKVRKFLEGTYVPKHYLKKGIKSPND